MPIEVTYHGSFGEFWGAWGGLGGFFPEKALILELFVKKVTEYLWIPLWEWGDRMESKWVAEEEKKNTVFRFRQGRK